MKVVIGVTSLVLVVVAGWLTLGWLALLVLPVGLLSLLMTLAPALVEWESEQPATRPQQPAGEAAKVGRPANACA